MPACSRRLAALAVPAALAALAAGCVGEPAQMEPAEAPVSMRGTLRVSAYGGAGPRSDEPLVHHTVYRNGTAWSGMEDVDLRGFLDGRFRYGWNQPTQVHVRAGRWPSTQRWGEYELYRSLHRWDDLGLPADVRVRRARLRLQVEEGPERVRRVPVLLYEVKKDFDPGQGGTRRDNISPPKPGEVWWNERAHGEEPWGLPGLGFASDDHPAADTAAQALAETLFERGEEAIVFESPALAAYVQRRARAGEPLLFLVKLGDDAEDERGSVVHIWSGNVGLDRNPARRPALAVDWDAPSETLGVERRIHLEYGRTSRLPTLALRGARRVAVSFHPEPGSAVPTVERRAAGPAGPGPWRPAAVPGDAPEAALDVRVVAAEDPLVRGEAFEASFRDTWITTAPPEEQQVVFTFVGPEGTVHRVPARYQGDFRYSVVFSPLELGRWRYFYRHQLDGPWRSADGVFDVLPGDAAAVVRQLRDLAERIRSDYGDAGTRPKDSVYEHGREFWRLERAALLAQTPEVFHGEGGEEIDAALRAVREAMDSKDLPERLRPRPGDRPYESE